MLGVKWLRTIGTILLTAGTALAMSAPSNCASAQETAATPEQASANERMVKRLKPDERARFAAECTSAAQSEQNECMVARAFVVQCQAVVDKKLDPILLWAFPGNFIVKYLSPSEKPIVLQALKDSTAALESAAGKRR
jgi:hypothetical protein